MATHSSILAWKIPWMEEPGGLQSVGSQRVSDYCIMQACRVVPELLNCSPGIQLYQVEHNVCAQFLLPFVLSLHSLPKIL